MPTPLEAQVDAARAYEALMVPALFEAWTEPVLNAAGVGPGFRVLDVACGTGVLARAAAERVGAGGAVAGVDLNPGMLAVAREISPAVDWREGAAESLPFANSSFDAVVSQFGIMFFQDRGRAVREMLRLLAPGGKLAVAAWDRLETSPAYSVEVAILDRIAGPDAADALRAPFSLGNPSALAALFEAAGVASLQVTTHTRTARFPSVRALVEADLRGWLPLMGFTLAENQVQQILLQMQEQLAQFIQPDGKLVFDSCAHIAAGATG